MPEQLSFEPSPDARGAGARARPPAAAAIPGATLALFALALAATLAAPAAHAQYKWVDASGRINYGDRPPADARQAAPAAAASALPAQPADARLPWALRTAAARHPVVLYTAPACEPCDLGRDHLAQRGVPFTEKHVKSADDVRAFNALAPGASGFPMLTVGTDRMAGYEASSWNRMLDAAAYPKTSLLAPGQTARKLEPMAPQRAAEPPRAGASGPDAAAQTGDDTARAGTAGAPPPQARADATRSLIPARPEPIRNPIRF